MKTDVTIGDLRHRLVLEDAVRVSDGGGGATETWTLVAEVWGAVRARSGAEIFDADRVEGRITHDIWVRYRTGVVPKMRFRFGTRIFDIRAVLDPDDRNHWLKCVVEERDL